MSEKVDTGRYKRPTEHNIPTAASKVPRTIYIDPRTIGDGGFVCSVELFFLFFVLYRNGRRIGNPATCKNADNHLLFPPFT